ncbi:RNA polymerase sigma factor (sigma-70 family) [Clostridium saccharoperbutylacetonicum]|uniref:RNA polymerase sigma factor, sigma-70 family n=1 Tax=Clostridium saccharoperbutylacetonicum N1-4(HMT) TaxID=931276 RepID=M1LT21_9CLOT|nr:sigma-70 family RNA polymerase sigma factor [Clostridium saccharoperbutylacetonicum]AGF56165.1 RNA polymerase sigma factor, sigma-70 family [Clostridium saccharoperbutylacetonicum N1-4(HMT)]NRT63094.1 RNA polymerase sigma factor (sigma-70 family) [Clostridium saccharoperbutylacetonicum]NSB26451.1 RNA polymerase sigma factor (sigma-70 family) [Clostridium saccharoperbutylacetonicum]NSB45804.1 RNA polymerase sigma factor (sigma-70 family) [Clostridium saccharoperbutylacetonicum]
MDFDYVEALVIKCKNNDELSKEKLASEFRPLILNISKRTFIDGYDFYDIQNECYHSLFKCVSVYNLEKHRFVAYATNAIKNNVNDLIRKIKSKSFINGYETLSFCDDFEKELPSEDISLEDLLCEKCDYEDLKLALKNLTKDEMELVDFVFFKNNTLQKYASQKSMCYSTAILKKKLTLKKIFNFISPLLLK